MSDFIWRTSSAKTAQSAELPASTAPPGPIETMKRRRGEAADSSAWYTTQYGSQHGPSIYDNCQNYSKTCCLAVTKIVETLVTKRVETATDVSLVLDGSGSMTCSWCEPKPSHLQNWCAVSFTRFASQSHPPTLYPHPHTHSKTRRIVHLQIHRAELAHLSSHPTNIHISM